MWLASGEKGEWLERTLEKLVLKIVQDFVSHNTELSVFGNPLKCFRQESNMITFMFDDHFSCFGDMSATSLEGSWVSSG